jgi:hypothetical protein
MAGRKLVALEEDEVNFHFLQQKKRHKRFQHNDIGRTSGASAAADFKIFVLESDAGAASSS